MFKFKPEVAVHVAALCKLLEFANSDDSRRAGKWSSQRGVYGAAYEALKMIVAVECGEDIAERVTRAGFNFGGNLTWFDDVCVVVAEAFEERKQEEADVA